MVIVFQQQQQQQQQKKLFFHQIAKKSCVIGEAKAKAKFFTITVN